MSTRRLLGTEPGNRAIPHAAVWGIVLQLSLLSCATTPGAVPAGDLSEHQGVDSRSLEAGAPGPADGAADRAVDRAERSATEGEVDSASDESPWRRVLYPSTLSVRATPGILEFARSVGNDEELARATRATLSHDAPEELVVSRFPDLVDKDGTFFLPTLQEAVDRSQPTPAERTNSFVIDFDSGPVKALLQELGRRDRSPQALEAAVYRLVKEKTYTRGFDVASRVAESRAGDCTEHAVLLTALLRAHDVPARVVLGAVIVISVDQVFAAGHAWTEYFDGQRWRRLDAALYQEEEVSIASAAASEDAADIARPRSAGASDVLAPPVVRRLYIPRLVLRREGVDYARGLTPFVRRFSDISISESGR